MQHQCKITCYMWIITKITPAVNWPGLAYFAQQLLKTRGALAPVAPPPLSYAHETATCFT